MPLQVLDEELGSMQLLSIDDAIKSAQRSIQTQDMIVSGFHHFSAQMERNGWNVRKYSRDGVVLAVCEWGDSLYGIIKTITYANSPWINEPVIKDGAPRKITLPEIMD